MVISQALLGVYWESSKAETFTGNCLKAAPSHRPKLSWRRSETLAGPIIKVLTVVSEDLSSQPCSGAELRVWKKTRVTMLPAGRR